MNDLYRDTWRTIRFLPVVRPPRVRGPTPFEIPGKTGFALWRTLGEPCSGNNHLWRGCSQRLLARPLLSGAICPTMEQFAERPCEASRDCVALRRALTKYARGTSMHAQGGLNRIAIECSARIHSKHFLLVFGIL